MMPDGPRTCTLTASALCATVDHFMTEQHFDVRKKLQPIQDQLRGLELFALHDEGMPRVVFKNGVIELRDQFLARSVPELKDRRQQTDARHVIDQCVIQEIERRRMRRASPFALCGCCRTGGPAAPDG